MSFMLRPYTAPDFSKEDLRNAPQAVFLPAPQDGVAPMGYHAMSIFPEYFHVGDAWLLAEDSRMDCVAVLEAGRMVVREFRLLKAGDLVAMGRTENGQEGVYVHPDGFGERHSQGDVFAFRQGRSRETAFPGTMTNCTSCSATSVPMAKLCGSWGRLLPLTMTPGGRSPV